jgi:hypothetical protein
MCNGYAHYASLEGYAHHWKSNTRDDREQGDVLGLASNLKISKSPLLLVSDVSCEAKKPVRLVCMTEVGGGWGEQKLYGPS